MKVKSSNSWLKDIYTHEDVDIDYLSSNVTVDNDIMAFSLKYLVGNMNEIVGQQLSDYLDKVEDIQNRRG